MPLKKSGVGEAIAAIPKPAASNLEQSYAAIPSRVVPSHEIPEEEDYRYSEFSYAFNSYKSDLSGMIDRFPELLGDVDIHQALVAIRNAERAIEARAKEILGG